MKAFDRRAQELEMDGRPHTPKKAILAQGKDLAADENADEQRERMDRALERRGVDESIEEGFENRGLERVDPSRPDRQNEDSTDASPMPGEVGRQYRNGVQMRPMS